MSRDRCGLSQPWPPYSRIIFYVIWNIGIKVFFESHLKSKRNLESIVKRLHTKIDLLRPNSHLLMGFTEDLY